MSTQLFKLPSALSRFERTGVVTLEEVKTIGTVGMAARMSGLKRDIRLSHPHDLYSKINHKPIIKHHGDVYSRAQIRKEEIWQSIGYIKELLNTIPNFISKTEPELKPQANAFSLSLVEGWRGEICHCAITDNNGELTLYKIKDPSFHNWLALAQSVRNNEISDFPVCNKSFNLSYCGHDL
jgi:Ni,Fe-hydrogenase III large subunit